MTPDTLDQLIAGTFPNPDGTGTVGVTTRSLKIAPSLAGMELDLVKPLGFGRALAVVSDQTTHDVLGARVVAALAGSFDVRDVVLPTGPYPDDETVEVVRQATKSADAVIAVGSGVINDICKYATALDGKPYAVFATAPSMNGYTSVNAAITEHGHKKSLAAQAPVGAFFDLQILAASPARMIRSGLGDSLCRTTSQADWLLAHLLFDQPYRNLPYVLLSEDESPLFESADALMAGDIAAMERLVRTLVLSGFGTAIYGTSAPASQGEHLISHYIDMLGPDRPMVFHGEQVGVTTLTMVRLQEKMLETTPVVRADQETLETFTARYGAELAQSCWDDFSKKRVAAADVDALNHRIAQRWDGVRDRVSDILLKSSYLEKVLRTAGNPMKPGEIHVARDFYDQAILRSREIRNRYTFLDLAAGTGQLQGLAAAL
jgi:glycerol-1-phosphate dehydrogenase [NAD(P)+]